MRNETIIKLTAVAVDIYYREINLYVESLSKLRKSESNINNVPNPCFDQKTNTFNCVTIRQNTYNYMKSYEIITSTFIYIYHRTITFTPHICKILKFYFCMSI